jgi:hypothetical protein
VVLLDDASVLLAAAPAPGPAVHAVRYLAALAHAPTDDARADAPVQCLVVRVQGDADANAAGLGAEGAGRDGAALSWVRYLSESLADCAVQVAALPSGYSRDTHGRVFVRVKALCKSAATGGGGWSQPLGAARLYRLVDNAVRPVGERSRTL